MQGRQFSPRCILNRKNGGRQLRNRIMTEQVGREQPLERRTIFESARSPPHLKEALNPLQYRSQSESKALLNARCRHEPSFKRLRDAISIRSLSRQSSQSNSINSAIDSSSLTYLLRQAARNEDAKLSRMLVELNQNCQKEKDTSESYFTMTRERSHKSQLDHFQQNKFLKEQCNKILKSMKQTKHRHRMSCRMLDSQIMQLKKEREALIEEIELVGGKKTSLDVLTEDEDFQSIKLHVHDEYFYGSEEEHMPRWRKTRQSLHLFKKKELRLMN